MTIANELASRTHRLHYDVATIFIDLSVASNRIFRQEGRRIDAHAHATSPIYRRITVD